MKDDDPQKVKYLINDFSEQLYGLLAGKSGGYTHAALLDMVLELSMRGMDCSRQRAVDYTIEQLALIKQDLGVPKFLTEGL